MSNIGRLQGNFSRLSLFLATNFFRHRPTSVINTKKPLKVHKNVKKTSSKSSFDVLKVGGKIVKNQNSRLRPTTLRTRRRETRCVRGRARPGTSAVRKKKRKGYINASYYGCYCACVITQLRLCLIVTMETFGCETTSVDVQRLTVKSNNSV